MFPTETRLRPRLDDKLLRQHHQLMRMATDTFPDPSLSERLPRRLTHQYEHGNDIDRVQAFSSSVAWTALATNRLQAAVLSCIT